MRLICIFKGTRLLDQSDFFHPSTVSQFKENVAFQSGFDASSLEAIMFEDEEMVDFVSASKSRNPKKTIHIEKESMKLINLVDVPTIVQARIDWKNCSPEQIAEKFSVEDQAKISENMDYYNSLGNEKFQSGFVFNWPHIVEGPLVDAESSETEYAVYKEIQGQII
jgi:hypothetical protein